jgi:uncharacterized peroxidase-related enzyme
MPSKEGALMTWIRTISTGEATGELAALYNRVAGKRGAVAEVIRAHSLNLAALRGHFEFYAAIMFGASPLSRTVREFIAVVVSRSNGCDYCTRHHGEALLRAGFDSGEAASLCADPFALPLEPRLAAIRDYVAALTNTPASVSEENIHALRAVGLDDRAIHDVVTVAAYFNFVNRVVMGLGVELETDFEKTCV